MKTVSPIKEKPLPQAGESLRERLQDLVFDKLLTLYFISGVMWVMALTEWIHYLRNDRPNPIFYTIFAAAFSVYAFVRGYFAYRRAKDMRLGLRGEQAVGEFLARLVAKGYRVYHDIPTAKGNIDHVIICSRGVFTIETKTRSKPEKGDVVVYFDGETLSFNGQFSDGKPIIQAKAEAGNLKTLLKEETGYDYSVKPVVVIPGWFVESLPNANQSGVWALNPKALHKWIDNEPETISGDRVKLAATKLGKFVRNR